MAKELSIVQCFRCYIEVGDSNHRVVVEGVPQTSTVIFSKILRQFKVISGVDLNDVDNTFLIRVENKWTQKTITERDLIPNASKIIVQYKKQRPARRESRKPRPLPIGNDPEDKMESKTSIIRPKWKQNDGIIEVKSGCDLKLIDTIHYLSKHMNKCQFDWTAVSEVMRISGHRDLTPDKCFSQFYSLIGDLFSYAKDKQLNPSIDCKTIKVFSRLQSMNLRPFVSSRRFKWIKRSSQKRWLGVKDTMVCLLVETSRAYKDFDYRPQTMRSVCKERTTDKTSSIDVESKSRPKSKVEPKTRKPKSKIKIDSIDSKLVSVIYKLQVNGHIYFDWQTIRHEMSAGADFYDTCQLKERFSRLIVTYAMVLYFSEGDVSTTTDVWPLFEMISKIDLRSFCDPITHQKIQHLRSQMGPKSSHYYNKDLKFG